MSGVQREKVPAQVEQLLDIPRIFVAHEKIHQTGRNQISQTDIGIVKQFAEKVFHEYGNIFPAFTKRDGVNGGRI